MNSPSNDSPELTAYALGELSAAQAKQVHALLHACPAATSQLEQVEAVTEALRQGAPIPQQRLRPDQRHSVLYPSQLPRRLGPMMPRPIQQRRKSAIWPALTVLAKVAALITVTLGAYALGRRTPLPGQIKDVDITAAQGSAAHAAGSSAAVAEADRAKKPTLEEAPEVAISKPVNLAAAAPASASVVEKPAIVVVPAKPEPVVAQVRAPAPAPAATMQKTVQTSIIAGPAPTAPKPAGTPANVAVAASFTVPPRSEAFINASRKPSDQTELRPAKIRPLPVKANKAELFAAPMPARALPDTKENTKGRSNELFIHSWRADVVSCPWNEATRLLRVVIQLPADQPAVIASDSAYPLQVAFDPNHVREYRMLCERNQPAQELRTAGTHVIWYEFQPNGAAEAPREMGKLVATVTLPAARFTTQAIEPFDGSKLRVMDRNQAWQNAREDFIFESSVVGFGMLLRGIPENSRLNHQLVLDLATKAKGNDPTGEHGRFIRLVQDAKAAAGL